MKVKIILTTIAFTVMFGAFGLTNSVIDSLENVLKTAKDDTIKVQSLQELFYQYIIIGDYKNAMRYADSTLALADRIKYIEGKADAYNAIGAIYDDQSNYPKALENYFASLKIREEIGDKNGIADSYNDIGVAYKSQGNYAEALEKYFASLKIREEIGDKNGIADSYNNIGIIYKFQGNYPEALKYLFASLKISEEIGNKMRIAATYNNMGMIYSEQGNYSEALENYFACLKIAKEIGIKYGIAGSYNNIGTIYQNQGNYSEALENYFASLKIREEIGDKNGIAASYNTIGQVYYEQGNYPEALKNYLASLKISEEIGDKIGVADNYHSLGVLNIHLGNIQEARKYLGNSLALYMKIGYKSAIQKNYGSLSRLDSVEGNFATSLKHYKMYTLYKDSLLNEDSNNQIALMKIQYETEKKEREMELLKKDNELQKQQLEKQRLIRNGMIAGTVFLIILGLLGFRSIQLRRKLEKQNAIVQERNRISADLHDDFGSSLSEIFLLSDIVMRETKSAPAKKAAMKIADNSRRLLESIGEIIWVLNSNNDYLESMVAYIRRYAAEYFENSTVKFKINTPVKLARTQISAELRRNIYYTVKEALHNIIKHAQATNAEMKIKLDREVLSIIIKDNGIGLPQEGLNRFGNGMASMQGRMKSIKGEFSILNHKGTTVILKLPVG